MDQLRENCPWDKEQTHHSLLPYLVEETYELVDAIEQGDLEAMSEELGDLLLQVVFHARIAAESGAFTIEDVAQGISEKLIARHPHVFGDSKAESAADVEENWERLKALEKKRSSIVEGIPLSQPSLSWTSAVLGRSKVDEALVEISVPAEIDESSIGELLLAVVALAQRNGVDSEHALRGAGRRLIERVQAREKDQPAK